jgi:mevalonate pyrophosphate decarboxylase
MISFCLSRASSAWSAACMSSQLNSREPALDCDDMASTLAPRRVCFLDGVTSTAGSASAVGCSLSPSQPWAAAIGEGAAGAGAAVNATGPLQPLDDEQQFERVSPAASSAAHRNIIMRAT